MITPEIVKGVATRAPVFGQNVVGAETVGTNAGGIGVPENVTVSEA